MSVLTYMDQTFNLLVRWGDTLTSSQMLFFLQRGLLQVPRSMFGFSS